MTSINPQTITSVNWRKYATYALYAIVALAILLWLGSQIQGMRPARLIQTTVTGLLIGGIYALVALGIVIVNKASGVFNFAHGYLMYFGAMLFFSFFTTIEINPLVSGALAALTVLMALTMNGWGDLRNPRTVGLGLLAVVLLTAVMSLQGTDLRLIRGIIGSVVMSVLTGLVIERFAIRPLIGQPLFAIVLMTLALDRILAGGTQLVWGSIERTLPVFSTLGINLDPLRFDGTGTWLDGRVIIKMEFLIAFILALVAFVVFVLFFRYTSVGLAMRATAENQQLARSVGLRVRVILAVAWAIAALLAMTAGVLQGGATNLGKSMPGLAAAAFPAVLLGGLESISGALVGGLVIGVVQEWAKVLPALQGTQADTEFAPYLVLMVILIFRPDGLFGQKRIDRI